MTLYMGYKPASYTCAGEAQPGAKELMAWFLGAYGARGARNDGIYNCRPMRGSWAPSVHGDGRAADLGVPVGADWAWYLANTLKNKSKELGIQCIIYDHKIWSGAHYNEGWRNYYGADPHTGHLHVELSPTTAETLTSERIRETLTPSSGAKVHRVVLTRYLQNGSKGLAVTRLQEEIKSRGHRITVDGDFGDQTEAWVIRLQNYYHLTADGIVGKDTAKVLGWVWKG